MTFFSNDARLSQTVRIEEPVESFLKEHGHDNLILFSKISQYWEFIFEKPLSEKIRPKYLHKGVLYVTSENPAYANAIRYKKHDILSYISVTVQSGSVKDIVFVPERFDR